MPSGEVHHEHFKQGYRYAIPLSVVSAIWDVKFASGYLLGYSFGRYCSPDWDVMGSSADEGRMVNELPIIGHLLYGISSTYGSIFRRRHRSFITHFPGISSVIRLIFVVIVPFTVLDAHGVNFIGGGWWKFWLGVVIGMSHADGIHWWLDMRR